MNSTSVKSRTSKSGLDSTVGSLTKSNSKMPTFGGISIAEIAVLGAAGFVLWKNRSKISALLEENGIAVPSFLNSDISEIIQSGVSMMSDRDDSSPSSSSRRHDA